MGSDLQCCVNFCCTAKWFNYQTVKNLPAVQKTLVQSLVRKDPLEKGMATYSSILAWRIPQTKELGRLQSMGLPRVRHDWLSTFMFIYICCCYVTSVVSDSVWPHRWQPGMTEKLLKVLVLKGYPHFHGFYIQEIYSSHGEESERSPLGSGKRRGREIFVKYSHRIYLNKILTFR